MAAAFVIPAEFLFVRRRPNRKWHLGMRTPFVVATLTLAMTRFTAG